METIIESEFLHMGLSNVDYALLATVFTENLYEEGELPSWTLAPEQPAPAASAAKEDEGVTLEKMFSAHQDSLCIPGDEITLRQSSGESSGRGSGRSNPRGSHPASPERSAEALGYGKPYKLSNLSICDDDSQDSDDPDVVAIAQEAAGPSLFSTSRITVKVKRTRLELFQAQGQATALARLDVTDWWLVFNTSSNRDWVWHMTLPQVTVTDMRGGRTLDRATVLRR